MIQLARLIIGNAERFPYEQYFQVKPFLDVLFARIVNHDREVQQMMFEYDKKLERKRRMANAAPLPNDRRFARSLYEARQFALSGEMPE